MANKLYRANWRLEGVGSTPLEAGDKVKLSDEDAAQFLQLGVLSLADAKAESVEVRPAESTGTQSQAGEKSSGEAANDQAAE